MSSAGVLPTDAAAQLLLLTQQGVGKTTTILKQSLESDKEMVAALLPTATHESGRVNIPA